MKELITLESNEMKAIEQSKAVQIKATFDPMAKKLFKFEESFNEIIKESENGITADIVKKAKRLRLDIAKVRTGTEKIRKEQKEEYVRAGKAIDGVANILKWAVTDKENKLKEIESYFEQFEKERLDRLQKERVEQLSKFVDNSESMELYTMTEEVFNAYLVAKEKEYNDRIEAEKKAEAERIERERLDRLENNRYLTILPYRQFWDCDNYDLRNMPNSSFNTIVTDLENKKVFYDNEQKRIQAENERLKKEAEEKERKRQEEERKRKAKEETERKVREEEARKKREEFERELKAEREEKERIAKIEREKREKAERELKEQREAERKRKEAEEAKKQADLNKGDKDKLTDLLSDLNELKTKYEFKSKKNIQMYSSLSKMIDQLVNFVINKR